MTNKELQALKNKFDIIGNDPALNRALEIAVTVAPTDITVLIEGESGVGKENIPKIVHQNSRRRTQKYFAVNCGAIPEGTIDSELFGHEKGSFTGASEMRKGYFEEANGGTLFLDEVGELPLSSQAKLLRVLQSGEFIRVGSSKVLKTDVRVIAATNANLKFAVDRGKFRTDLYYRLNAVTIKMPALRDRPDDIHLLFRKFASDFSSKYGLCGINLTDRAVLALKKYRWPGNIRQLKNLAEKVSVMESARQNVREGRCTIDAVDIDKYIPNDSENLLPATTVQLGYDEQPWEREAIIRTLYQLRQDVDYLKKVVASAGLSMPISPAPIIEPPKPIQEQKWNIEPERHSREQIVEAPEEQEIEEVKETKPKNLSIQDRNEELIVKALERNAGNRKKAAADLGISERTLYRKIKQMGL